MASNQVDNVQLNLILNGKQAGVTMRDLTNKGKLLRAQLRGMAVNSKEFADTSKDLKKVNQAMADIRKQTRGTDDFLQKLKKTAGIGGLAGAFALVANKARDIIKEGIQIARQAQGITTAFNKLNDASLLSEAILNDVQGL